MIQVELFALLFILMREETSEACKIPGRDGRGEEGEDTGNRDL